MGRGRQVAPVDVPAGEMQSSLNLSRLRPQQKIATTDFSSFLLFLFTSNRMVRLELPLFVFFCTFDSSSMT